jgi:hypothetical protein
VKVSRSKLSAYKRFVEVFFSSDHSPSIDFHSIIVDTSQIDDRTYNGGSRQAGFDKEIYQLISKFWRLYNPSNFHVYLDERSSSGSLADLRTVINRGLMKNDTSADWPIRRLHFRDSSKCQALQLVDILLGAVAFHLNGHRRRSAASPA